MADCTYGDFKYQQKSGKQITLIYINGVVYAACFDMRETSCFYSYSTRESVNNSWKTAAKQQHVELHLVQV